MSCFNYADAWLNSRSQRTYIYDPEVANACLEVFTDKSFEFDSPVIAKLPQTR